MSELKGKKKVDDGDRSWLELLNSVEASTSIETRLVTEMENKMMVEKEGLKSCHEAGVEEGKQDYLIDKQKKQKTSVIGQFWPGYNSNRT
ncbi:hypothetical protein J1N35_043215 [Gossypium stocksii]|uniref:Uncharacterized protein n=1 Tax=Gossypium stocksii TaxID=47602 RepID=A0A9D3ZEW3_9ROSI|nr:hypothetical protein J1N35_043215 [Gossypium stocksii]